MEGFNDVWANILEFPLLEEDKKQAQNKGDLSVSHHMIGDISAINQNDENGKPVNTMNPEDVSKEEGQLLKEINEVLSNPATNDPPEMKIENQEENITPSINEPLIVTNFLLIFRRKMKINH